MKRPLLLLMILITAVLTGCAQNSEGQVKVIRVIDGDTIEIAGGSRVRYIGIDAPEVYPQMEFYGPEARDKNKELVEGKMVILKRDVSDKDRYGRLLRYVDQDGLFVNEELVRLGYARAVPYPPDTRYQEQLVKVEEEARNAQRGLWQNSSSPARPTFFTIFPSLHGTHLNNYNRVIASSLPFRGWDQASEDPSPKSPAGILYSQ